MFDPYEMKDEGEQLEAPGFPSMKHTVEEIGHMYMTYDTSKAPDLVSADYRSTDLASGMVTRGPTGLQQLIARMSEVCKLPGSSRYKHHC